MKKKTASGTTNARELLVSIADKSVKAIRYLQNNLRFKILYLKNKKVGSVIERVMHRHLTFLEVDALWDLAQAAINNEKRGTEGIIIEAGCALGGSAITLASAKSKDRMFIVYDVFGMIPPPSKEDGPDAHERYRIIAGRKLPRIGGNLYYGYEKNLYEKVVQSFADFGLEVEENNIYLKKGLFQDTLKVESQVSLAHIDCDWYDSVLTCLNRIEPYLVKGGTLILDDYYSWSGCRSAVHKYFESKNKGRYDFIKRARLHIVKR